MHTLTTTTCRSPLRARKKRHFRVTGPVRPSADQWPLLSRSRSSCRTGCLAKHADPISTGPICAPRNLPYSPLPERRRRAKSKRLRAHPVGLFNQDLCFGLLQWSCVTQWLRARNTKSYFVGLWRELHLMFPPAHSCDFLWPLQSFKINPNNQPLVTLRGFGACCDHYANEALAMRAPGDIRRYGALSSERMGARRVMEIRQSLWI